MFALAFNARPGLTFRNQPECPTHSPIVEDDASKMHRPLHEVVSGQDLRAKLLLRQDMKIKLP